MGRMSDSPAAAALGLLAAWNDPTDGLALYDAYAADALLPLRLDVLPRRAIDRREFAYLIAAAARTRGGLTPPIEAPELGATHQDGDHAVLRVHARDLDLLIGCVREPDGWRAGWITLAPEGELPGYGAGLALALAETGVLAGARLYAPRGWLDAAYHRKHLRPAPELVVLPDARFGCQSSTQCCEGGFNIAVPAAAQALLDAVPWEHLAPQLAGTRLEPLPDGTLLLRRAHERCRFLEADKRCMLHAQFGFQPFPVCSSYPFEFTDTPDGVAVPASTACPSARRGLGPLVSDRQGDLHDRLALVGARPQPARFQLAPGRVVDWPTLRAAEADLQDALSRGDLALADRLYLGERALLARLGHDLPAHRPQAPADAPLHAWLAAFDEPLGFTQAAPPRSWRGAPQEDEWVAMLQNLMAAKVYTYEHDLLAAWHVAVFLGVAAMRGAGGDRLPDDRLWQLNRIFRHNSVFRMLGGDLQARAADPGFGVELLSLPGPVVHPA